MTLKEPIIETAPTSEDVQFLQDRITEFNLAHTGIRDDRLLSAFVRNDQGEILAGIYGWTWGGVCEIRYLWVKEELRRQGLGRRLLQMAEGEAQARGCGQIVLDTHSFQAPEFYRKLGYETIGIYEDYPRGQEKIFLRKRLR